MIRWMFDSAELPPELGSLDFCKPNHPAPGELRSDAADALRPGAQPTRSQALRRAG